MSRYGNYSSSNGSGSDIITMVQVVLIVLKTFDLIDWSWPMVFAPLWGTILVVVIIAFFYWLIKGGK